MSSIGGAGGAFPGPFAGPPVGIPVPATAGVVEHHAARLRAVFLDLDGTLLGRGASLLRDGEGGFSSAGVRALEACFRAGVEVCLFSGRGRAGLFHDARLLGVTAYVFEAGGGVVVDGETEFLTGGLQPEAGVSVHELIARTGAPDLLLEHFVGRIEHHAPWHHGREVTHLLRGDVRPDEAAALLADHGIDTVELIDNGRVSPSPTMPAVGAPRSLHLVPRGSSKAAGVARIMRIRGFSAGETIAVGDSRADLGAARAVGTFWLVANAVARDPDIVHAGGAPRNVRVAEAANGAGVLEAVMTTLAERRGAAAAV